MSLINDVSELISSFSTQFRRNVNISAQRISSNQNLYRCIRVRKKLTQFDINTKRQ